MQWIHIKGRMIIALKSESEKWRFLVFKCTAYVRLPWEHREKVIGHLLLHKPTVNIHILNSKIQLEEWIHLPVLLDKMLYKVQYTFNTLFCTSLFLSGFAYIFMLFSEKITSACKKLNKESEHKNFFFFFIYIYIFLDLSCLTHTNVSDHLQKPKNIEILEINYKTKKKKNYKCIFPYQSEHLQRPPHPSP